MDRAIKDVLLHRLAVTNRFHGDSGLEFRTVGAALAHEWEPPFQGRHHASEVKDDVNTEKLDHLNALADLSDYFVDSQK